MVLFESAPIAWRQNETKWTRKRQKKKNRKEANRQPSDTYNAVPLSLEPLIKSSINMFSMSKQSPNAKILGVWWINGKSTLPCCTLMVVLCVCASVRAYDSPPKCICQMQTHAPVDSLPLRFERTRKTVCEVRPFISCTEWWLILITVNDCLTTVWHVIDATYRFVSIKSFAEDLLAHRSNKVPAPDESNNQLTRIWITYLWQG